MTRPTLLTREKKEKFPLFTVIVSVILLIVIALFLFEIWFMNRYTPVCVDGGSMEKTLQDGDWLYADTDAAVKRNDIVIVYVKEYEDEYGQPLFRTDAHGERIAFIIKRVIALEGDMIYAKNNQVYLKEKGETEFRPLEEAFAYYDPTGVPLTFGSEREPVEVGAGEMFVMGDNRLNSYDSTEARVGTLLLKDVTGVVPQWAVEYKSVITGWESFRDTFRN